MKEFLLSPRKVPSTIIFSRWPQMLTKGFFWALKTFMTRNHGHMCTK